MKELKIKVNTQTAVQLGIDINHIIEQIVGSDIGRGEISFRNKVLGLRELGKWKRGIRGFIEGKRAEEKGMEESELDIVEGGKVEGFVVSDKIKESITFLKNR